MAAGAITGKIRPVMTGTCPPFFWGSGQEASKIVIRALERPVVVLIYVNVININMKGSRKCMLQRRQ